MPIEMKKADIQHHGNKVTYPLKPRRLGKERKNGGEGEKGSKRELFTNMPLEEIIEICTSNPFKKNGVVHGLKKVVESHFIFNNTSYKQFDVGAMASPLGSSLANACLVHYKQN